MHANGIGRSQVKFTQISTIQLQRMGEFSSQFEKTMSSQWFSNCSFCTGKQLMQPTSATGVERAIFKTALFSPVVYIQDDTTHLHTLNSAY